MSWDELLAALVGFVGRKVHAQVWSDSNPEVPGASVVSTTFGVLSDTDDRFVGALPGETLLVRLKGSDGEFSGVLSIPRDALLRADRLDADRIELVLGSTMLGIYAE